jgi:pimeloyl-ACP methyl ester carboxylesterase
MIPGRRLPTSTAELYSIGLGSGPPLLFLHGVTANCFTWLPVMELLQDSYAVTAVDQPGHGRSGLPRDHRFDAAAYARDTTEVAASLGHGPVVVVGHSLGARNAIAAAARRPAGSGASAITRTCPATCPGTTAGCPGMPWPAGPSTATSPGRTAGSCRWPTPAPCGPPARGSARTSPPILDASACPRCWCAGPAARSCPAGRCALRSGCAPGCAERWWTGPTTTCPRSGPARWPG